MLLQRAIFQTNIKQKQTHSSENYFYPRGEGWGRHKIDEGD